MKGMHKRPSESQSCSVSSIFRGGRSGEQPGCRWCRQACPSRAAVSAQRTSAPLDAPWQLPLLPPPLPQLRRAHPRSRCHRTDARE